jgi:HSP20 family molecular chaperone IbpA
MASNLIDEVNRLFDELVHDPWRRPLVPSPRQPARAPVSDWAVEIPLQGVVRGDVSVTTEGGRLTVTVLRRTGRRGKERGGSASMRAEEHFRQSFVLPEGTVMRTVEASFEDGLLRIRVGLRRH